MCTSCSYENTSDATGLTTRSWNCSSILAGINWTNTTRVNDTRLCPQALHSGIINTTITKISENKTITKRHINIASNNCPFQTHTHKCAVYFTDKKGTLFAFKIPCDVSLHYCRKTVYKTLTYLIHNVMLRNQCAAEYNTRKLVAVITIWAQRI